MTMTCEVCSAELDASTTCSCYKTQPCPVCGESLAVYSGYGSVAHHRELTRSGDVLVIVTNGTVQRFAHARCAGAL